jgi:hypothetical protein
MFEYSAPWFIQNEAAQSLILLNPAGLFPNTVSRWWIHSTHYNITDFSLSMTGNDMYYFS